MEKIFSHYCNLYQNGLVIFDAPTGTGKTTAAVKYIEKFFDGIETVTKQRIIYVTNLKTNLPYDDLKKNIGEEKFNKNCIVVKPYYEMILDSIDIFNEPPTELKIDNEYRELKKQLEIISKIQYKIKIDSNEDLKKYLLLLINQLQSKFEPNFREAIKRIYYKKNKPSKAINEWIEKIYLCKKIKEAKVIFMSTKRFILPIDVFTNVYYLPKEKEFLKDSIVIFDEFDSTKQIFLDHIISLGIKNNINLVSLVSNIHFQLENINLDSLYNNLNSIDKSPSNIIGNNKIKFKELHNKYKMEYPLKKDPSLYKEIFIFNEETKRYISDGKNLICSFDEDEKLVGIYEKTKEIGEYDFSFSDYVNDLAYYVHYFSYGVVMLSNNLKITYNDKVEKDREINQEEALKSILSYFKFNKEITDFIYDKSNHIGELKKNEGEPKRRLFYQHGFSLQVLEDSYKHILDSYVSHYDFSTTPEQIIYEIAEITLVFGMSATASIDTVIGNYSLDFFRSKLQDKLLYLDETHRKIIRERLDEKERCFKENKSQIHVSSISSHDGNVYVDDQKILIDHTLKDTLLGSNGESASYYRDLLLQLVACYKELSNKNIKSFIMFFNKYDMNNIKIDCLNELLSEDKNIKIFELKTEDFNNSFEDIEQWLSTSSHKALVYTTYNTIGTGKNIQYEVPDSIKDQYYISFDNGNKKDFDAIYLAKPTRLLEYLKDLHQKESEEKLISLANALFQITYLYKAGQITNKKKEDYVYEILNALSRYNKTHLPQTKDYSYHLAKIIIQAVGRICRTNNKSKDIYIYAEKAIMYQLNKVYDHLMEKDFNKEFIELLKKSYGIVDNEKQFDLRKYTEINRDAGKFLFTLYRRHKWTKEDIKEWKELREHVLKYPTDNDKRSNNKFLKYYFTFDKMVKSYKYNANPQNNIIYKLSVEDRGDSNLSEVSGAYANLNTLMKVSSLKELFINKGYARYFREDYCILSPVLFKGVYMGALGEVCGKCLVEEFVDIKLTDVADEYFEYFDYKYRDYYFDFKNWRTLKKDRDYYLKKILPKMKEVNAKKLFLINLISDSGRYVERIDEINDIIEIPFLVQINNERKDTYGVNNEFFEIIRKNINK